MSNPIVHIEMSAKDHGVLAGWYARHFGWKTQTWPEMDYTTATWSREPGAGAGFGPASEERPMGTVLCYIQTDDIDVTARSIAADGGVLLSERMEVPNVGATLWFEDPAGNRMALLQPEMLEVDE
jgi:predicted enzyme related to lactoylglutathione lyase